MNIKYESQGLSHGTDDRPSDDRTAGLPPAQRLPDILECDGSPALVSCPSFANQIQIRFFRNTALDLQLFLFDMLERMQL